MVEEQVQIIIKNSLGPGSVTWSNVITWIAGYRLKQGLLTQTGLAFLTSHDENLGLSYLW